MRRLAYWKRLIAVLVLVAMVFLMIASSLSVFAAELSERSSGIWISDEADLLTDEEESQLADVMEPITNYGSVGFYTTNDNSSYNTKSLAEETYYRNFGNESGMLFVIDMDMRNIYIACDGTIYKYITTGKANTIADNVYRYASDGDYFGCAKSVFQQAYTVLDGGRIAEPMKYASNAVLAVMLGMLLCFWFVILNSRIHKASAAEMLQGAASNVDIRVLKGRLTHTTKTYDPPSSSSGGSSGGGGGGGGGGFSGGGGGHSF